MKHYLSKSQYMRAKQCHKSLWLYKNNPELRTPPDESQQVIFDTGTNVGLFARDLFPGGKEIKYEGSSFKEKIKLTRELIQKGAKTIYEATITYDNITVMVDILHKGNSGWEIYEVKATNEVKDNHYDDAAIQYYVLKGSGLDVSSASIVHLNRDYKRKGALDIQALFKFEELTQDVIGSQDSVKARLAKIRSSLDGKCPDIDIGAYCDSPYECDFKEHCWSHIPDNSIFDLRGKGINKYDYYYNGTVKMIDLDLDILNEKQKMQADAELKRTNYIDCAAITTFLDSLHYPQCYLDFETFMPAIPPFDGSHPYGQIAFQYSLHYLESKDAELKHYEFLMQEGADERESLVKNLTELIPDNACVITYNSSFEKSRLKEMAELFPAYSSKINEIIENMIDLMVPFQKRHYYTKEMKGSYSIKYVLPTLVPGLSYKGMAISDGGAAMNIYSTLHLIKDKKEVEKIRQDLFEYCKLDTLAMVRLIEKLKEVCKNSPI